MGVGFRVEATLVSMSGASEESVCREGGGRGTLTHTLSHTHTHTHSHVTLGPAGSGRRERGGRGEEEGGKMTMGLQAARTRVTVNSPLFTYFRLFRHKVVHDKP